MADVPQMSKRHFEYIADIINGLEIDAKSFVSVVNDFADDLGNCNDLFNRTTFVDRCNKDTKHGKDG